MICGPSRVGIGSHCEPFGLVLDTTRCHVYVCSGEGIDFEDELPGNLLHDLIMTGSGQIGDLGPFGRGEDALVCPQALVPVACEAWADCCGAASAFLSCGLMYGFPFLWS